MNLGVGGEREAGERGGRWGKWGREMGERERGEKERGRRETKGERGKGGGKKEKRVFRCERWRTEKG